MELAGLVGEHKLSGVDMSNESVKREWGDDFEQCEIIRFRLDDVIYMAIEDPSDGYRSSMREIKVSDGEMKNVFAPVKVLCRIRTKGEYGGTDDTLEIIDMENGLVILEVGTDNCDDYYPMWVGAWHPERMAVNAS